MEDATSLGELNFDLYLLRYFLTYSSSGVMLKCGLHKCPSSCHQLFDHSKVLCRFALTQKCSKGHIQSWECHASAPPACVKCERERKEAEKKAHRALEEKRKRDEKTQKHLKEVAKLQEEMEQIAQEMRDARLDSEQKAILEQKRTDLAAARERANRVLNDDADPRNQPLNKSSQNVPGNPPGRRNPPLDTPAQNAPGAYPDRRNPPLDKSSANKPGAPPDHSKLREHVQTAMEQNKSPSKTEWQRQKEQENAQNPAIDRIMELIGLEDVKAQILRIKAKVETSIRQDTDLSKERLGLVLLGNPGTGIAFIHSSIPSFNSRLIMHRQDNFWPPLCPVSNDHENPFWGWIYRNHWLEGCPWRH
jgi:hypothetical protein